MPTFGISAFLKLICLNERSARRQLRARLSPSTGGYDFHRSLRLRAHRHLVENEPMEDLIASTAQIARIPEQISARVGLERLEQWRRDHHGTIRHFAPVTYESPGELFKVTFSADFGVRIGSDWVAVHLWNTAKPALSPRMVYAALSLFAPLYAAADDPPNDIAILSLREPRLFRFNEAGRLASLGVGLADRIDDMLRDIRDELEPPRSEDRPESGH